MKAVEMLQEDMSGRIPEKMGQVRINLIKEWKKREIEEDRDH